MMPEEMIAIWSNSTPKQAVRIEKKAAHKGALGGRDPSKSLKND
jgi:hypothetical protein